MDKIRMTTPLVEMDGDEMTRILWQMIKDELLLPYIDLKTEYYDLGLKHRDETDDQVTIDAANANMKYGVSVKCATITPNAARMEEYNLKALYKSPNGTIRAMLDGTVFRAPILVKGISPQVRSWEKPITIARHAYGDVYKNTEMRVDGPGTAELVFTAADGTVSRKTIHVFDGPGVVQGMHNLDASIESFSRSCFTYALSVGQDLWFATKDTISKTYDRVFKEIFEEVWEKCYDALDRTCSCKFRQELNVSPWLMKYWQLCKGLSIPRKQPGQAYHITDENFSALCTDIRSGRHKLICVNDTAATTGFDEKCRAVRESFESILPEKSGFEKN